MTSKKRLVKFMASIYFQAYGGKGMGEHFLRRP